MTFFAPAGWAPSVPASDRQWLSTFTRFATAGLVLLGIGLRFLLLDADPHYYEWIGYITDEGRWTDRARELALYGELMGPLWSLQFIVAPLYQLASYVVFLLTDVGVTSSRLLSAVSGSLVLVTFWAFFRATTTPQALFLALAPLALQVDLVTLSRLAVPEMPAIALQFALYLAITCGDRSVLRCFGTGLLALLAVGMKITIVPAVGILSVVFIRSLTSSGAASRRRADLLAFLTGLVGPVLLLGLVLLACCLPSRAGIDWTFELLRRFLGMSGAYDVVSFPFEDPLSAELNLWGLAVWYALVGWRAAQSGAIDSRVRRHVLSSAAWLGLYLGFLLLSSYSPNRYKVHVLLPMSIIVAVGVGLLQQAGIQKAEAAFITARGFHRVAGLAFIGLPTAAFIAPLVSEVIGVFVGEPFRVRTKIFTVVISLIGVILVLEWCRRRQRRLTFFLLFPVIAAFAWVVAARFGLPESTFWPTPRSPQWLSVTRPMLLLGAGALSAAILRPRSLGVSLSAGIVLGTIGYVLLALTTLAPGYLSPHYSIRDTSRQLGTLLAGYSGTVATSGGDGLFRENRLRYKTVWGRTWPLDGRPEVIVTVFNFRDSQNILVKEYCQIGEYSLYIAPSYYRAHPKQWPTSALGQTARVYERRPSSRCPDSRASRLGDP